MATETETIGAATIVPSRVKKCQWIRQSEVHHGEACVRDAMYLVSWRHVGISGPRTKRTCKNHVDRWTSLAFGKYEAEQVNIRRMA